MSTTDRDVERDRTLAHLLASLDGVWDTLRAVADWYEEQGEVEKATAYRWLAESRRWPSATEGQKYKWLIGNPDSYCKWADAVEALVYDYLETTGASPGCSGPCEAYQDLAQALVKAGERGKGPLAGKVPRKAERRAENPPYTLRANSLLGPSRLPGEHQSRREARQAALTYLVKPGMSEGRHNVDILDGGGEWVENVGQWT